MPTQRGPDGKPWSFHDLPAEMFPVRITCFEADGTVAWERTVEPYVATEIPGSPPGKGGTRSVKIEYGNGDVINIGPEDA